jgi:hypothetical protein
MIVSVTLGDLVFVIVLNNSNISRKEFSKKVISVFMFAKIKKNYSICFGFFCAVSTKRTLNFKIEH